MMEELEVYLIEALKSMELRDLYGKGATDEEVIIYHKIDDLLSAVKSLKQKAGAVQ